MGLGQRPIQGQWTTAHPRFAASRRCPTSADLWQSEHGPVMAGSDQQIKSGGTSAISRVLTALLIALLIPACTRSNSRSTSTTKLTIGTAIPPSRDETAG